MTGRKREGLAWRILAELSGQSKADNLGAKGAVR